MAFLASNREWLLALHLIFVISWMAGIFYLPRLFVYHTRAAVGSEQDKTFQVMEYKLLKVIMNPAMMGSWVFGSLLLFTANFDLDADLWMSTKLLAAIAMTVFHMVLARWRRMFAEGRNEKSESFFRRANEVPTILMIVIVVMVMVKPF